jgi:uncharacterized protein YjbJ (UPF0337 family)
MGATQDKAEGKVDELKGKAKEGIGDATDNEDLEAEGKADQVEGKAKGVKGDVKDAGEKVKEGINKAFD